MAFGGSIDSRPQGWIYHGHYGLDWASVTVTVEFSLGFGCTWIISCIFFRIRHITINISSQLETRTCSILMQRNLEQILSILQLLLGRHVSNPHQLRRLHHKRIHAHTRGSNHRIASRVVRDELTLSQVSINHQVVPAAYRGGRISAVAKLATQRGPKDRRRELRGRRWVDNVAGGGAAGVLCDVPVLDAGELAVAAGTVVRESGDVADGVYVLEAGYGEVLVRLEGPVFFEADDAAFAEVFGGRGDADAKDDEVGVEFSAVFEVDAADVGGARVGGVGLVYGGVHVELDALLLHDGLDRLADFFTEYAF